MNLNCFFDKNDKYELIKSNDDNFRCFNKNVSIFFFVLSVLSHKYQIKIS